MLRLAYGLRAPTRLSAGRGMWYTTAAPEDIRKRLTDELKTAMKAKDTLKSTTIRSVLAEVYSADKLQAQPLPAGGIVSVLRKAVTRRADAAAEFDKAARADLAEKERKEADVLQAFVPPLLATPEIDRRLQEVLAELQPAPGDKKALGQVFKAFYARVDRSAVDTDLVKKRAEALLAA